VQRKEIPQETPQMKCLITGITGFAASHLADVLLQDGHEVIGTQRLRAKQDNVLHLKGRIKVENMELHDPFGVEDVIKKHKPDAVFHLAAQSFVGWSWKNPEETLKTNINGTLYVLNAIRDHVPNARVHVSSSSQIYGNMPGVMGKETLFNPMNPYDTSKLAQDMLALQYYNSYSMNIVRTRAFNISGPRRDECFAESSWAKQIAEIEAGKREPVIYHGNLESERDYIDVRDVVQGYRNACFFGTPGAVYILGSGIPRKMRMILGHLVSLSTRKDIVLKQDMARMRPSDTPTMQADTSDVADLIGEEKIPLYQTLEDLLNYWRIKVNEDKPCHV